ncbi:MAG: ABC transporter substrate-binding protein [Armatimonadota bacterium]
MTRRRSEVARIIAVVGAVGLLVLTGFSGGMAAPAPAAPGEPVRGGALTLSYPPGLPHIDTNAVSQTLIVETIGGFYERLYERDSTGKAQPHLVESEQISSDGLTVTWKLKPNIKFHDGSAFNAEAVKWNFERKISKRQIQFGLLPFRTIEAVDERTVRVALSRPSPNLHSILTMGNFAMYSPRFTQQVGDEGVRLQASGTGPFQLVEFRPQQIARLRRNPNYWQQGLPYLDEIVYRVADDINTRATMLAAGDVDIAREVSFPDAQRFKTTAGIKVLEAVGSRQYVIYINTRRPIMSDVRVRQAVNYGVDKEGIIKTVMLGNGKPATVFLFGPRVTGFTPTEGYPYNPDKARALLEEAGWRVGPGGIRQRDGQPLRMIFVTRKGSAPGDFEIGEQVQGMLRAVGVDVNLQVHDSATLLARMNAPGGIQVEYDMLNLSNNTFTADAEYIMLGFYRSVDFPPNGFNYSLYSNPQVDRLIEGSLTTRNLAGRNSIYYSQIIKQVVRDAPGILLFDIQMQAPMKQNVQGVYLDPAYNMWPAKYAWKSK